MPDSSMAAKRTIPPEEPSRDMARATAERNTVKVYLQRVFSRRGTSVLELDHAGHDLISGDTRGGVWGLPLPTNSSPKMGKSLLSIFRPNQGSPTTEKFCPTPPPPPPNSLPQHYYLSAVSLRKLRRKPGFPSHTCTCTSDFVTKSYGGSWDSSCEKS